MKTSDDLRRAVRSLDRRGYPSLKSLAGAYTFDAFTLVVDHVQGDPFASPSSLHVEVPHEVAGFPVRYREHACARRALADFLTRCFARELARCSMRAKGSGKSGLLTTSRCGQEVLSRSACEVGDAGIVMRFSAGFPAFGRSVNAEGLEEMLLGLVPRCVKAALLYRSLDARRVEEAVWLAEDQEALRSVMREEGIVAFVANGSVLPRASGVSELPLAGAVSFVSPPSLERAFRLPHRGEVVGMAVPRGVTLVVGGGYHGKSTLLEALQSGVYDHVAGDGREFVLTDASALKLRAEDGRAVRDVDISAFIGNLPNGKDTRAFSTECASGSTSQAAAVVEGVEAGVRLFLVDEDTSATNFMVRDELMSRVITPDKEPITPFVRRVRELYEACGVSTILVAGSSGAFFSVADVVVQMDCYRPRDITERVCEVCVSYEEERGGKAGTAAGASTSGESVLACGCADDRLSGEASLDACAEAGLNATAEVAGRRRMMPALAVRGDRGGRDVRRGEDGSGGRGGADGRRGERGGSRGRNGDARARHDERMKVKAHGCDTVSLGKAEVDVRYIEQITDSEQTLALGYLMRFALERFGDGRHTIEEAVSSTFDSLDERGWQPFSGSYVPCGLARPRKQELFAALNRLRAGRG